MKKKIDLFWYWFIFVVAFVLCFFVVNDKKANAYTLNSEGNLVSDNLLNMPLANNITNANGFLDADVLSNNYVSLVGSTGAVDCNGPVLFTGLNLSLSPGTYTLQLFNIDYGSTIHGPILFGGSSVWSETFRLDMNNMPEVVYSTIVVDSNYTFNSMRFWSYKNTTYDLSFNVMLYAGSYSSNISFEPFGVWYSQNNYDTAINESYQNGYNEGFVENNSIPSIYIKDTSFQYVSNSNIATNISVTDKIITTNATLDFTQLLNSTFSDNIPSQTMYFGATLITKINVTDTLTFTFNDISNLPNYFNGFILFGDSACFDNTCGTSVYLTYSDIVSNNYSITLNSINPNLTIDSIDTFIITYYYDGNFLHGVKSIVNDTLYGSGNSSQYDLGYSVGYIIGESNGKVIGEEIGYDKGYSIGYRTASQVVSEPGNNTLVGMVSVIMGMPVNMLIDIYNFEFLGVNLAEFFLSLVTLMVSIWLIKKML